MKYTTILQFQTLTDLAKFVKSISVSTYVINTQHLSLKACLTEFEIAIAVEQYEAHVMRQSVEA